MREVDPAERSRAHRGDGLTEAALEHPARPAGRERRGGRVPRQQHARQLHEAGVVAPQRRARVHVGRINRHHLGAVRRGQRRQTCRQVGGIAGRAHERGADRIGASVERERAAHAVHAQAVRDRVGGESDRSRTPRHEIPHLGGGQGPRRGRGGVGRRHGRGRGGDRRRTGHHLHVVDERQAPAGDVVDLIGLTALPPLFLPRDELGRLRRGEIQQIAHQPAGRLRVGHDVGTCGNRARADGERPVGAAHLDALRGEVAGQCGSARRVVTRHEHVVTHRAFLPFRHRAPAVLEEVAHQPLAIAGGGDGRRDGGVEVMQHAVAEGQDGAVGAGKRQRARRGLLVGHADRAVQHRPTVAVTGIEPVVDLAHVVGPAAFIEARGVGPAEELEAGDLRCGVVRVQRVGRRREVVAVVAALLVQVDVDLRKVVEGNLNAPARLWLRLREPVAVHVEQVVIRPPARPGFVVLRVVGRRVGRGRLALQVLEDEAGAAVGILHRVDEHQRVAQHRVHAGVAARRQQMVGLEQRRIARADLVAVHAVHEPHHHRRRRHEAGGLSRCESSRIGQPLDVGLHLVELRETFGTADDEEPQRAALPGSGVLGESRAVGRRLRQRAQVGGDLLGRRDLVARGVADDLLERRNLRVVLRAGPERLRCLREGRGRRRGGAREHEEDETHGG